MSAFFSSTDDANENNTQFYGVWGDVENDEPEIAFRYVVGDKKVNISPTVLFDWPTVKETTRVTTEIVEGAEFLDIESESDFLGTNEEGVVLEETHYHPVAGPFKQVDYPEGWMEQHEKKVYTPKFKKRKKGSKRRTFKNKKDKGTSYSSGAYNGSTYNENTYENVWDDWDEWDEWEQAWQDYQEIHAPYDTPDELDTLMLYPEKHQKSIPSFDLQDAVLDYLKIIRLYNPELYNEFLI